VGRGHQAVLNHLRELLALRLDKRGVTAIEYCLIAAFIATVIIGAVTTIGNELTSPFQNVNGSL
jgi:pilus assembly protein Flp/PilA